MNEKKRTIKIQFQIRGNTDRYDLFLTVGSSGFGTLNINSQNRQPISYTGTVLPLKKE